MRIKFSYPQNENQTLLMTDEGSMFLVDFNTDTETIKGLGFIDYDSPLDEDETTTSIEILNAFIVNDELKHMIEAKLCEEVIIKEYLEEIHKD